MRRTANSRSASLAPPRRGKEMVDQIMAFAETRAAGHGVVNLGRAMETSHELIASSMHPGAMLEIDMPQDTLLTRGNEVQVVQMIANLVSNGRDALDGGGGLIEIQATAATDAEIERLRRLSNLPYELVEGEPEPGRRYARLTVSDSGRGIKPEIIGRVFEPFFSTKGRERGTGLGLAVVHGVIRAHGGFCHLKSVPGKGTAFHVYLPLVDEPARMAAISGPGAQLGRVLIVDDEADMADMLSIGLERLGYATVAVQTPLMALEAIEEDPAAFDTLLTDQQMPAMSGMDLIRAAKRAAPHLRAILCTGNAAGMKEAELRSGGADAVLYKPVEIQAVAAAINPQPQNDVP